MAAIEDSPDAIELEASGRRNCTPSTSKPYPRRQPQDHSSVPPTQIRELESRTGNRDSRTHEFEKAPRRRLNLRGKRTFDGSPRRHASWADIRRPLLGWPIGFLESRSLRFCSTLEDMDESATGSRPLQSPCAL